MATAPVKSPLHNFPLTFLKWGSTAKNPHHHNHPNNSSSGSRPSRRPSSSTPPPPPPPPSSSSSDVVKDTEVEADPPDTDKPWNLRPRKPTLPPPSSHPPPSSVDENIPKSTRLRGLDSQASGSSSCGEKRKFWIALSRDEIEEDIYSLTGSKPSRRPRKRPKNVQKQLDNLFPGLWLVGLTPEAYRGLDNPPKR